MQRLTFATQAEVNEHDGDLRTRDDENTKYSKEETEEVIELVLPDGGHDEEDLDEAGAEGQHTADEDEEEGVHVPGLIRNHLRELTDFTGSLELLKRKKKQQEKDKEKETEKDEEKKKKKKRTRRNDHRMTKRGCMYRAPSSGNLLIFRAL